MFLLLLLPLLPLFPLSFALRVVSPAACGGAHIVTHATAFFGPKAADASVCDVPLFAPRAQENGVYLVAQRPVLRQRKRFLHLLFSPIHNRQSQPPHPNPLLTPQPQQSTPPTTAQSQHLTPGHVDLRDDAPHEIDTHSLHQQPTNADASNNPPFNLFNACRQLSVKRDLDAIKGRVAVVARGVCDFAQKVGIMQDAGAVAVIVVNSKEENENLANMKLNETKENPEIKIPAVMIRYKDWLRIAPCSNETTVEFSADGVATFDDDYGSAGRDALNWAMMRGVALWILCQCGVNVVRHKRRESESRARADAIAALPVETYSAPTRRSAGVASNAADEDAPSTSTSSPLSQSHSRTQTQTQTSLSSEDDSVERISLTAAASNATENVDEAEDVVCAVCLESFEDGQQVRSLPCSHLYHQSCIDPWLQFSSNCCPLCKREVPNLPPPPTQMHYGSMVV